MVNADHFEQRMKISQSKFRKYEAMLEKFHFASRDVILSAECAV